MYRLVKAEAFMNLPHEKKKNQKIVSSIGNFNAF